MTPQGGGVYEIILEGSKIANPKGFEFTEFHYQFVATDKNRNNLARTDVYKDVQLDICP
jgi:hypothetical protein